MVPEHLFIKILPNFYFIFPGSDPTRSSSLIKNQVDEEIHITANNSNKYKYQANRAFIIGRIKTIFPKILCDIFDNTAIDRLFLDSLRRKSQIIPGRSFRRKKNKAKGRTHFKNQKVAF